ncbi:MAG: hypothetical protein ACRBFS_13970 [Aureispira sp.]
MYYNDKFVEQIEAIAKNEQEISYELTDFVEKELYIYDSKLTRRIKNRYFTYEEASTRANIIWTGGGYRTIRRAIQNKFCQEDLFNVIGYYTHRKKWKKVIATFILPEPDEQNESPQTKGKMKVVAPITIDKNYIELTNHMEDQFTIFRKELSQDQEEKFETLRLLLLDQKDSNEAFRALLQNIIQNNKQIKRDIATLQASQNNTNLPDNQQHLTSLWWMLLLAKKGEIVYNLEEYTQNLSLNLLSQNESLTSDIFEIDTIWDWIQKTFF